MFIVGPPITKTNFACEPGFREQFQRAIDGSVADAGIFFLDEPVKIFAGKVCFGTQEDFEDEVSLGRTFQPLLLNVFKKDFLLFGHKMRGRCDSP